MLVENKFLFLGLPRCISTAFYVSCMKQGIDIKRTNDMINIYNTNLDLIDEGNIKKLSHSHETVTELRGKFGNEYPIVSVRRNKYERFYSFYKKFCKELIDNRLGIKMDEYFHYFTEIDSKKFFDYDNINLSWNIDLIYEEFKKKHSIDFLKYGEDIDFSFKFLIFFMLKPVSHWTEYESNIKWFDFENLVELENWVSHTTGKDFHLEKFNSSFHKSLNPKMKINEEFMELYDKIYKNYDLDTKTNKSLI